MQKYLGKRPKRVKEWARLGYSGKSDDPDFDYLKPRPDPIANAKPQPAVKVVKEFSGNDEEGVSDDKAGSKGGDALKEGYANFGGYEYKQMGPKTNWAKYDPYQDW